MKDTYKKMLARMELRNDRIRRLRDSDPSRWTLAALGKKFGLTPQRIMAICRPRIDTVA